MKKTKRNIPRVGARTDETIAHLWNVECWHLARARKQFEVEGSSKVHENFFKAMCAEHRLKQEAHPTHVVFIPLDKKQDANLKSKTVK